MILGGFDEERGESCMLTKLKTEKTVPKSLKSYLVFP